MRVPRHTLAIALLLVISAYLTFKGLDGPWFWDDEAEVGIIARNVLAHGELTGWDGRNLFAYRNGTTLDAALMTRQPPLMFWVAAASFKVLGVGTAAGRLPFALFGFATVLLLLRVMRRDFPDDPWVWCYSVAALGLSCGFLLYARQCRYFSLGMFFALLCYDQYRAVMTTRRLGAHTGLALAAALLFYSHYLLAAVFLLALALVHAVFYRRALSVRGHLGLAATGLLFLTLTVPYALGHAIWLRPDLAPPALPWLTRLPLTVWAYVHAMDRTNALPAVGVLALLALVWRRRVEARAALPWLLLVLANTIITALVTPQDFRPKRIPDVRYLVAGLPFAAGCMGIVMAWLHRRAWWQGVAFAALLLGTNALSGQHHLRDYRTQLSRFLREIHTPFPTATQASVQALMARASPDDCVMTVPTHQSFPIMFYAGDTLRLCCLLDRETPLPEAALRSLDAPPFCGARAPRWVLTFGEESDLDKAPRRTFDLAADYSEVERLGVYARNIQRPELVWHNFGPKRRFDHAREDVILYERRLTPPG